MAQSRTSNGQDGGGQKVVGPNIMGKVEEYRLERLLQNGLFGGVYEAKGRSSGRLFAVKVLHRSELQKVSRASRLDFCEVPLSEIRFSEVMSGLKHVVEVEDHFEDQWCHYIVFQLAEGGDLLEALKLKPHGFEEHQAQFLVRHAALGLSSLHQRHLAMQDVSLENLLMFMLEDGQYVIKVSDPGQATKFEVDEQTGEELPVNFHGFVGKSFRPPELHLQKPYLASKVDAWCLGWSTFYLLSAQTLFLNADPSDKDQDWVLFRQGEISKLFRKKGVQCSKVCLDFILRLLDLDPQRRLSVQEALQHDWLTDPDIKPMYSTSETPQLEATTEGASRERGNSIAPPAVTNAAPTPATAPDAGVGSLSERGAAAGSSAAGPARGGSGASANSRQYSSTMPAWPRAPPSRSESPGSRWAPGSASSGPPRLLGAGLPGMATINRYAPSQPRNPSPFSSGAPRGFVPLRQQRSQSPPPRLGVLPARGVGSTDGANWLNLGTGTMATPRPGRAVAGSGPAVCSSNMGGISGLGADVAAEGGGSGWHPPGAGSSPAARGDANSVLVADAPAGDPPRGSGLSFGSMRAKSDLEVRLNGNGLGDIAGVAGGVVSGIRGFSAQLPVPRQNSPLPRSALAARAANSRNYSPSPTQGLQAIGGSRPQAQARRAGSPMQQGHTPGGAPPPFPPVRGVSNTNAAVDAGSGHYWQSPRAANPGVLRAPEGYSRGRSHTRALSPVVATVNTYGAGAQGQPAGMVRTVSPTVQLQPRATVSAGFAWSPVPHSPPPKPTRSLSPAQGGFAGGSLGSGNVLPRWGGVA